MIVYVFDTASQLPLYICKPGALQIRNCRALMLPEVLQCWFSKPY